MFVVYLLDLSKLERFWLKSHRPHRSVHASSLIFSNSMKTFFFFFLFVDSDIFVKATKIYF